MGAKLPGVESRGSLTWFTRITPQPGRRSVSGTMHNTLKEGSTMLNDGASGAIETTRVDAITGFLQGTRTAYELVEHERTTGAAGEARATRLSPDQIGKTSVVRDVYVMTATPSSNRLDLGKLRDLPGATRQLRLANEEEIARDFPLLEVGAVP